MQRERSYENGQCAIPVDVPVASGSLDKHRDESDSILHAADELFDSLLTVFAQTYLHQSVQPGGQ
jgi:hypothetical protein